MDHHNFQTKHISRSHPILLMDCELYRMVDCELALFSISPFRTSTEFTSLHTFFISLWKARNIKSRTKEREHRSAISKRIKIPSVLRTKLSQTYSVMYYHRHFVRQISTNQSKQQQQSIWKMSKCEKSPQMRCYQLWMEKGLAFFISISAFFSSLSFSACRLGVWRSWQNNLCSLAQQVAFIKIDDLTTRTRVA